MTFYWTPDTNRLNTNVTEKVDIFIKAVFNIIRNFIPHELILCDDKDPACVSKKIRTLIREKKCGT